MTGTVFPQIKMLLPNGEIAGPWRFFFQNLYQATNGGDSAILAANVVFTPVGTITLDNVQSALAQLDTLKVPVTRTVNGHNLNTDVTVTASDVGAVPTSTTVNGHPLSANVTVTASDVGAPSGSGTSTGANTGDQTITLSGDASGSGTAGVAVTVSKIGGKSVSLAGSLTTSGAFASTFTMTGVTAVTFPTSGTLATVDGNIGNATGTSLAVTGALSSSGTAGVGYATGAGGTVTQATSKTTNVTLNKVCGEITMNAAALASGGVAVFSLLSSSIASTDMLIVDCIAGVSSVANYDTKGVANGAGSAVILVKNVTAGSLSEAVVLRFMVLKVVNA